MVAYSFQKMFAEDIRFGLKNHTVRGERKRHARPGETLQLYTGMRTKHCRKIIEDRKVDVVFPITLRFQPPCALVEVVVDGERRDPVGFAALDGFRGWRFRVPGKWTGQKSRWTQGHAEAMGAFWRHNAGMFVPEWSGWIIHWQHRGVIASPEAYVDEFGATLCPERFGWLSQYMGWAAKPEDGAVNGLPPDLPDLGVGRADAR